MSIGFTLHLPGFFPAFYNLPLNRTVETSYIQTTCYPTFYKHIVVEFNVPAEWGNCLFDVYRSETNSGPWSKITPTPITGNYFKDVTTMDFSKFMQGFYIVECILPDQRRIQGTPTTWGNKRNKWVDIRANEIQRREMLLLTKFTGVETYLFRRRHFGMRCTNCWNHEIEKVTKDHCSVCLGTSFQGGYYPGFKTLLQYEPSNSNASLGYQGRQESLVLPAWTISYPAIEVFDVVLRVPDWKLYRVDAVSKTELQATVVRQILNLTELGKESIEFDLAKQAIPDLYE